MSPWLILVQGALSQEPPPLRLHATPGARVVALPRTDPQRLQWTVYENVVPLDDQLGLQRVNHLLGLDAVDLGGSTWVLTVWVDAPDVVASWSADSHGLRFDFALGSPHVVPVHDPPSLSELLADQAVDPPAEPTQSGLHPLLGRASSVLLDPATVDPEFPVWTPQLFGDHVELLHPPDHTDAYTLDTYRQGLVQTDDPYLIAASLYRLGQAHEALGMTREARYYYGAAQTQGRGAPALVTELAQARVALSNGAPETARAHCQSAAQAARPSQDRDVLACLALVSLETGHPAPGPTGRALARSSGRPIDLLLAGQLLVASGHPSEAAPLLDAAERSLPPGPLLRMAQATQGDAAFLQGDLDSARRHWTDAGPQGELGRTVWLRQRTVELVRTGPTTWTSILPDLVRFQDSDEPVAADAYYLEAQIAGWLSEPEGELVALGGLVERFPHRAASSDAAERLWAALDVRLSDLTRQGRWLDVAATWHDHYHPVLEPIAWAEPLQGVVQAYEVLGLPQEALDVQRTAFAIETRRGTSSPIGLIRLARLYEETDHAQDALRTLDFLDGEGLPTELRGAAWLIRGDAWMRLDDAETARGWWMRAAKRPETRDPAELRLALDDAESGRCQAALPRLTALAERDPDLVPMRDGRLHLVLARCLVEAGDTDAATLAARDAAGRSDDPEVARFATWLAQRQGDPMVEQALRADTDLWAVLSNESDAQADFNAAIAQRRGD